MKTTIDCTPHLMLPCYIGIVNPEDISIRVKLRHMLYFVTIQKSY